MRRAVALLLLSALAAACGRADPGARDADAPAPTLRSGAVVDATPAGYRAVLRSLRGRPVVVSFWASWCVPCEEEMPRIVDAAIRYEGRIVFLGVDVQDATEPARRFIRRHRIPFPSLADPDKRIMLDQEILGLPATQFYRSDGRLASLHSGEIKAATLEAKLRQLLRESGALPGP